MYIYIHIYTHIIVIVPITPIMAKGYLEASDPNKCRSAFGDGTESVQKRIITLSPSLIGTDRIWIVAHFVKCGTGRA